MKRVLSIVFLASIGVVPSCMPDGPNNGKQKSQIIDDVEAIPDSLDKSDYVLYNIMPKASKVVWQGERITGEYHRGSVEVRNGNIKVADGRITGGELVLDMTSMKEMNPESEEVTLVVMGYLQSERFFNTDKYPQAILHVRGEKQNYLMGDLTIKNVKKAVQIPFTKQMQGDTLHAVANFKIDRTDWGIDYRSAKSAKDLGNLIIKDSVGFKTTILAIQSKE